ncbi:XRE family transcriptional regulator [Streptomyces sp. BG9H]|uniref:XRE family transcriptional regulator n=1 Tax=Streptomyces anatolicus TaxID=2675858 RepID=A0ABS6YF55_9ACTN|nr:XRE family transcriptional regulator [Streptomyces anatolicus]
MPRGERPLDAQDGPLYAFALGLRRLRQRAGSPPYRTLAEQAHYSVSTLSSAASGQRLPTLAVTLAYVRACDGDVVEWERRWREVAERLGEEASVADAEGDRGASPPYAGLRPFREQDAERFFGREQLVEELAGRLKRQRFVVVIGASGSGKSSLLHAGLVPRLRSTGASVVVLTPGWRPLEECAVRLAGRAGVTAGALYEELRRDPENLGRAVRQATARSGPDSGELVLVVDQFEEIFTLCRDDTERNRFVEALTTAASHGPGRCRVVLGVRADFYAHCTRNAPLVTAMRDAQVPVGPMSLEELRRVVTQPAVRAGLTVEGALLATLTAQAYGQAGVLPLLSHALLQTWRRRRGNALTLAAFEAAGGLEGALARTAEEFYRHLDPEQRDLARAVFVRLTALGEGTEDTRRPVVRAELAGLAGADDGRIAAVLDDAAAARLVTLDREQVELAHEALIRCWPRLYGWLAEDREATRTLRRLTDAAQTWEALGRDAGALYRGARLDLAGALEHRSLSGLERRFLDASLAAREAEQDAARRRIWLRRAAVAVLSVLLVLASVTAFLAVRAQRIVDHQRDTVSSQRAAEKAAALRTLDPALAAQVGLAAYRLAATPEARGSVLSTYATPYSTTLAGQTGRIAALAFGADGRVLAVVGTDRTLRLWRATDPHHPRPLGKPSQPAGQFSAVAVSADSRLLAAGDEDGDVTVWNIGDPRRPRLTARLPGDAGAGAGSGGGPNATANGGVHDGQDAGPDPGRDAGPDAGPVVSLAFAPDGRTLATAARGAIRLWDLAGSRTPRALATRRVPAAVTAGAFTPDGRRLATGHADRTLRLWKTAAPGGKVRPLASLDAPGGEVRAVTFAPGGRRLATGSTDFSVRRWDVKSPREGRVVETLEGHTDTVNALGYSPDGRTLASGSTDATVRRWAVAGPGPAGPPTVFTGHTGGVRALAFHPDGRSLASGSEDQTARLWDLPGPALTGHTSSVYSAAFSPDGRSLATGSYDRTVRLWPLAGGRVPGPSAELTGHKGPVNSVAFRPDGRTLASGSADGSLRLWSVGTTRRPRLLRAVPCRIGHVNAVAFSPDGRTLATGGDTGTVRLWDTTDVRRPRPLASLTAPGGVGSLAFAPDGRTLALAEHDHTVTLWQVGDRRRPVRKAVLTGHSDAVKSVAFSPDGQALASGSEDRTIRLWDLTGPDRPVLRDRLDGYTDGVMSVAFAPDGRTLAAASSDHTTRLYDVTDRTAVELAVLSGHTKAVDTLSFGPDGMLATGSEDWTALLWDTDVQRLTARVCDTVWPAMSRAQWRQYFPQHSFQPPC